MRVTLEAGVEVLVVLEQGHDVPVLLDGRVLLQLDPPQPTGTRVLGRCHGACADAEIQFTF